MTLREQIGQLLIVGVEGTELQPTERAWIKLIRPGGIILFRRNIEQATQVASLLREATELASSPLFRCVDVEGGLVDRLRDLIAPMPSPAAVFATGKTNLYKKHGRLIAQEVKALGFNTTLAPVLDLALPASAKVLQTRAVSPDFSQVIEYASAFLDGLKAEGILGCGKHFPGLGGGALDSHKSTPQIQRTWEELWSQDIAVYRSLASRLPIVMAAHATYPKVLRDIPASVSNYWIKDVLKKRIDFHGLVLSDDMEMGGILNHASIEEATVQAILAGTDIIEICRDPSLILRAYEALLTEAESSVAMRRRIAASYRRIQEAKQRLLDANMPRTASASRIEKLQHEIKKFQKEVL